MTVLISKALTSVASVGLLVTALHAAASAAEAAPRPFARSITELKPVATLRVGETADWVAVTADAAWVGSTGPNAVHRIDPQTNELIATVMLPGEPCAGLATGFGSLWVPLCTQPASLAKVDIRRSSLTAVFKVGPAAEESGVTTSPDSVWLVTDANGSLARIDPKTGAVRQMTSLPPGSYNPLYASGSIWVTRAEGAEVTSVDATTGAIVAKTKTGPNPRFLTASSDAVWTLNQGDGSLTRIDPRTKQVIKTLSLGTPGHGGDISFGDGLVWITVKKIPLSAVDSTTSTLLCQWVGEGGDSLGIGHGAIWLTDYHAGTITRLDLKDAATRCRSQADGIVGTWRLVEFEDRPANGPARFPYGTHPEGLLIYDATGHMSIQIMKVPHPKVVSGDDEKVSDMEKMALFDAYVAYFGTYRVDAARGVVVHHVEGDLADVYVGREEERPFQLSGDHLTLRPKWISDGKSWQGIRVFERVQ